MATAISAWINVLLLAGGLISRGHYHVEKGIIIRLAKYILCSAIMGGAVWYVQQNVSFLIYGDTLEQILGLVILVLSGLGTYILATIMTKTVKKEELRALFSKR